MNVVYQAVTPTEFINLKALMGDTSDNIPGIAGVARRLQRRSLPSIISIENAHEHASELKPPRASKAIIEHWDLAVLSKTLATIKLDAEIDYEFADAKPVICIQTKHMCIFRSCSLKICWEDLRHRNCRIRLRRFETIIKR